MPLLVLLLVVSLLASGDFLQCLDAEGSPVDWYLLYKVPRLYDHAGEKFRIGEAFFYLDVKAPSWTLSTALISDKNTAITTTLSQVYASNSSVMYLLYNDASPPINASLGRNKRGHTKGVVAFDKTSGFWMIHSAPQFPPRKAKGYQWQKSASEFGQNFMCVTFPLKRLNEIGHQLLHYQPHVYDWNFPQDFVSKFPVLSAIIRGGAAPGPPWFNISSITSLRGQSFKSFAKSNAFGADLYDSLVAPTLQTDLMVETWMNGPGDKLPTNCSSKYKVYNIDEIALPEDARFNETIDHSKWAVASSMTRTHLTFMSEKQASTYWVCSGDINRKSTQLKRGGGCLCLQSRKVWAAFSKSISNYQHCA